MSSVVRPRSVANPSVGIEVYIDDLRTFKGEKTWPQIVGKSLVKDNRQVLPRDVVTMQPLFLELMSHGLRNCMVMPSRLEQACRTVTDPTVPEPYNAESYALALADHIRIVFNFVRVVCMEEATDNIQARGPRRNRRYPKTGTFRRTCTTSLSSTAS